MHNVFIHSFNLLQLLPPVLVFILKMRITGQARLHYHGGHIVLVGSDKKSLYLIPALCPFGVTEALLSSLWALQ